MINIISILIYAIANKILSRTDFYIILTIHFGILAIKDLIRKQILITPITIYYLGVIIVNIANIGFVAQLGHQQLKIYNYIIPKYVDDAAQIWCISSTMFAIGYNLYIKKSL